MAEAAALAGPYLLERDTLVVRGPDRKTWLDGLLTCAVGEVTPGTARYGLLLTKQGKIVSDVFLADSGSELFVGLAPGHRAAVSELLDRYLVMEDAELGSPPAPPVWVLRLGAAGSEPTLAQGALTLRDLACSLAVSSSAPADALPAAALAGLLAEHGLGSFGVDFNERDNPHEASLDRVAVSWTKGCYLGQEVVCMQDMRGKVKRRLVALAGDASLLGVSLGAQAPSVLGSAGVAVGHVTSVHRGPGGEASGAFVLASLSSAALEANEPLSVLGQPVRVVAGASL